MLTEKAVPNSSSTCLVLIRGRVVNADGSPAAEVPVLTRHEQVQTDGNGAFVLENLEPGPQQILFGIEGGQQATIKAPASDVRLVLKPGR
jgi:hypothetical protein